MNKLLSTFGHHCTIFHLSERILNEELKCEILVPNEEKVIKVKLTLKGWCDPTTVGSIAMRKKRLEWA